jgi:hypothetical protein
VTAVCAEVAGIGPGLAAGTAAVPEEVAVPVACTAVVAMGAAVPGVKWLRSVMVLEARVQDTSKVG